MRMAGPYTSGVAAGSAGSALNNQDTQTILSGKVNSIYVRYVNTPPNTTDVIIKTKGTAPAAPSLTLLTLTNKNTSGYFRPRVAQQDGVGVDISSGVVFEQMCIEDFVNVSIAQSDPSCYVEVWLFLE